MAGGVTVLCLVGGHSVHMYTDITDFVSGGWRYCRERRHFPDNLAGDDTDLVYITGEHRVLTSTEAEQHIRQPVGASRRRSRGGGNR